ncbi:hypothetical protein [uncultured Pseudodesulfovibrio sp.]|uniref:hypothetical protein n=1 Tax=uncultured Pseudodesulfovibrio sp. TaxID=2035858 RepID=UPI0029C81B6F|nr:hypothetical protein [uncultured Pseudodesulfovibrio sp.]
MFEFGKTLMTKNPEEQKTALKNATGAQRKFASEMGIGINNRYGQNQQRQQQRQQKQDAFHYLDRLNHVVEKENEAHAFFGGLLGDWQKGITGKSPSKDATKLKGQFDDYERGLLSELPKGGKRHTALSESLPKIKDGFLKQGHQFAVDKLNERSRSVLGNGLKRIAKDALSAKTDEEFQQHDDRAAGLINKYVLSEAKFDEKDADIFYDQFLKDAGVPSEAEQKTALAANQIESVSGEASDSWAGEAQLNAQPSKDEVAADETKATEAELQIPDGEDEVYEGSQYRGKIKPKTETPPTTGDSKGKTDEKLVAKEDEPDQLEDYLSTLGKRESSGKYNIKNTKGYLGKYQMGSSALTDAGYMKNGKWTGKDGIDNEEAFLNSPEIQEKAIRSFVKKQWSYAKLEGLDKYVGKTINGIKITRSGIIAGVHLKGARGTKPFFETNGKIDPTDGFKTPVSEYIKKMGGFNLPFTTESKKSVGKE